MSGEASVASVTDLGEYLADARTDERFADLVRELATLRWLTFEPPSTLLPAILAELDRVDRFGWVRPTPPPRWVAYAGGLAAAGAGALVLASRNWRSN